MRGTPALVAPALLAALALCAACGATGAAPRGGAGQACHADGTCNAGLACDAASGACVAATPGPQGGAGQACYADGTCDSGLICDAATRTCSVSTPPPADCGGCAPGETCDQLTQTCRAPYGDCRDVERACQAPFVCRELSDTGELGCRSPAAAEVVCDVPPVGQAVPFSGTGGSPGHTVHWTLAEGCIAVSYAPELASWSGAIADAAAAWTAVSCSRLCLSPPSASATGPDLERRERRIHARGGALSPGNPGLAETKLSWEQETGRVYTAEIIVGKAEEVQPADFLQLFGFAIGLGIAGQSTESVMAPLSTPRAITALTALDRQAACTLYGEPSLCGE